MTMLSGPIRPRRATARRGPPVDLAMAADGVAFTLNGEEAVALPEGGLWLRARRALIVSDLHLEKGSAFGRRGQFLPPYDTAATLRRLEALITRLAPQTVVSLGDSFHDPGGPDRMSEADAEALARLSARAAFVWIEGNHDPAPPAHLGGTRAAEITLGGLHLRHEPRAGEAVGEIAGHLHPCARVGGRGRSVRARCFATDGRRLVMPAFGAYAGGLNVRDPAFAPVFPDGCLALMLGRSAVHPAPAERLIADAA